MKTTSILLSYRLITAWAAACWLSTASWAQTVPALVNYQGRLANPDGTPLPTGDYTLTFRVFASATNTSTAATNLIWGPQVFDGVNGQGHGGRIPVVQGYFNVMLGPVDTNGLSLADAFNATNRYVEIRVGTNNPILPRQQILSAPYALNSAKLAGADWSAVFGTNDPVNGRIPTTKLATNGALTTSYLTVTPQNAGAGEGGEIAFVGATGYSGFNVDVNADRLRVFSLAGEHFCLKTNGCVGVGTASPVYPLHVKGAGAAAGGIAVEGNQSAMQHRDASGTVRFLTGLRADLAPTLDYVFHTYGGNWIFNGGNLGVGTMSPGYKMNVRVNGSSTDGLMTSGSDSRFVGLFPSLTGGSYNALVNSGDCAMIFSQGPAETGNLVIGPYSATAKGMKVMSDGKVGIGTSAPQGKFHVSEPDGEGNVVIQDTLPAIVSGKNNGGAIYFGTVSGVSPTAPTAAIETSWGGAVNPQIGIGVVRDSLRANLVMDYLNTIRFRRGTTTDMFVSSVGDIGVGTSLPEGRLHVATTSEPNALVVKAGGRVGIGTTSPSSALHVVGTVTATSFNPPSDRNLKQNFRPVSTQEVLQKVTALPITRWNFIGDAATPHLGPMAQDFHAAFGLGTDERHIATVDADGVALAAIQGLNQKLEEQIKAKDAEIQMLKAKSATIDLLEQRLAELERRTQSQKERN